MKSQKIRCLGIRSEAALVLVGVAPVEGHETCRRPLRKGDESLHVWKEDRCMMGSGGNAAPQ